MPTADTQLYLHEELMLLALRDERGTMHGKAGMYGYAVGAALVSELMLADRITLTDDARPFVEIADARKIGEPLLDECLTMIADSNGRTRLLKWVTRFAGISRLRHRIAQGLCRRGVLTESEDRVLWLFRRKLYPEQDPKVERQMIDRLQRAIFTESPRVQPRTAMLVTLAHAASLLHIPFDRKELKRRKARLAELGEGQHVGKAAGDAVAAAQAAVIAACTAASISAAVTTTH